MWCFSMILDLKFKNNLFHWQAFFAIGKQEALSLIRLLEKVIEFKLEAEFSEYLSSLSSYIMFPNGEKKTPHFDISSTFSAFKAAMNCNAVYIGGDGKCASDPAAWIQLLSLSAVLAF